jgi:hypothetical protein
MFPIAPGLVGIGYLVAAIIGLIVGALSGIVVSLILKLRVQGIATDAFLGAIGFAVTTIVGATMPWPPKIVTVAASIAAVILPALHQWFRLRHLETQAKATC